MSDNPADTSPAPEGTPNPALGQSDVSDWRNAIDESFRNSPTIRNIQAKNPLEALNAMAQMTVNAQKLVGTEKIPALKQNATPEERLAWKRQYLGVPENQEGYGTLETVQIGANEAGEPEMAEVPEDLRSGMLQLAAELGLDKETTERLVAERLKGDAAAAKAEEERVQALVDANISKLKQELGYDYQVTVDTANVAINRLASPELVDMIAENKLLANNPEFIKLFAGLGQQMMDSRTIVAGTPAGSATPAEAKARIAEIHRTEAWQRVLKGQANPTEKEQLQAQLDTLYLQAYPTKTA